MDISLSSIAVVKSDRTEIFDDAWDSEVCYIELHDEYSEDSLQGLEEFSHVEVIFYMDKLSPESIINKVRHPRGRKDWPEVGIFAQRNKNRPNQLGLTRCKIKKIEGRKILLEGLDAIDGTPVLDIKPWVQEFSIRGEQRQPPWMTELMKTYW